MREAESKMPFLEGYKLEKYGKGSKMVVVSRPGVGCVNSRVYGRDGESRGKGNRRNTWGVAVICTYRDRYMSPIAIVVGKLSGEPSL